MKHRIIALSLVCAVALPLLSGCDFFRAVAGRPTSAQLEQKREALRAEAQRAAEAAEAAKAAEPLPAPVHDARAEREQIARMMGPSYLKSVSGMGSRIVSGLKARYCYVVGAFSDQANAERLVARIRAAGYEAGTFLYKSGRVGVSVCPSDDADSLLAALPKLRGEDFFPEDAWVLVNE